MALPSSPSDASPLFGHLHTLYPLACLLTGPDEAPNLLIRVYQRAAEYSSEERPDDLAKWLVELLQEESELSPADEEEAAATVEAPSDDLLRQDVAEELVEHTLPIALAACSPQERFLLAVDAFEAAGERSELNVSDNPPSDAFATLQVRLRDVLSATEYDLVEDLSRASLREALREWVASRFGPAPSSLRTRIRATIQTTSSSEETPSKVEEHSKTDSSATLPSRLSPRGLLLTLLIGALVLAGGLGVTYVMQSSSAPSSPSTSLVAFSAERAPSVALEQRTTDRSEAKRYVESTWGRQIEVPTLTDAQLQGIGRVRSEGTEIPVFLYANPGNTPRIAIFAYSYALVDRMAATATLDTQVRAELARRNQLVVHTDTSAEGLLWRDRDDIFVAVASSMSTDSLRARLQP